MRFAAVAAASPDLVIGIGGKVPWDSPEDLAHFRRITHRKPVIMGRKTFESIGRSLPDRKVIVLTKDLFRGLPEGATAAGSAEHAVAIARSCGVPEAIVAGGAEIYSLLLPHCSTIYWTRVYANFGELKAGTEVARFPFDPLKKPAEWREVARWEARNHPAISYHVLSRA